MKVYFINNRFDGCYYVRCYLPMYHNGWDGNKTSMYEPQKDNTAAYHGAMNSDIVVFHRPDQKEKADVIPLLKAAGKKVVVDNDDTYAPDSGAIVDQIYNEGLETINSNLMRSVKEADLVTASTPFLKKEYLKYNKNVHVLPNYVDPDDWGPLDFGKHDKIRVGITGSLTITPDYEIIKDLLKEMSDDERYQLVVLGLPPDDENHKFQNKLYKKEIAFWKSLNIEWHPFVPAHEYVDKLKEMDLDIALIPRQDNYFNRCKSNVKFLEMSMVGVPCIVSGWKGNPYEKDKKYLLTANSPVEWKKAVEKLSDGKVRRDMGVNARSYVELKYNIHDHANKWKKLYKELI